jgi:hypothetical protein
MSDDELFIPRFLIEPEPTQAELVAILISMQSATLDEPEETPPSQWSEAARREQLRCPLDDRRTGWNR